MMTPPDETYTAAEAAAELGRCERQIRRYLKSGALRGSRAAGRWTVTALDLWRFRGIEAEMLDNWRRYCLAVARETSRNAQNEIHNEISWMNFPGK